MTKRTLLQVARQIAKTEPGIASDVAAIAEYAPNDDEREWLASIEMRRYADEGHAAAAILIHDALYPSFAAIGSLASPLRHIVTR